MFTSPLRIGSLDKENAGPRSSPSGLPVRVAAFLSSHPDSDTRFPRLCWFKPASVGQTSGGSTRLAWIYDGPLDARRP